MTTTYLFNSDRLYPLTSERSFENVEVKRLTLVCHNVQEAGRNHITGSNSWKFQVVGKPDWYVTSYDWALVLNTEENLKLVQTYNQLRDQCESLKKWANSVHAQVLNVKTANLL